MAETNTMVAGLRLVPVERAGGAIEQDAVAVEEPLEIRLDGKPLVVTMRTPGQDDELAAGFLFAEGVIDTGREIRSVEVEPGVSRPDGQIRVTHFQGDRVSVLLRAPGTGRVDTATRDFRATAACGVCGKEQIDDLQQTLPTVHPVPALPNALVEQLPARLREHQTLFDHTGGIHAAGLFTCDGELLCVREDIGRHNAVDKLIGHYVLRDAVPLADRVLVVSGRAGFELVQKALKAAIPVMIAVGAASSLAVQMATDAGMALYSFAGPGRGNRHVSDPGKP